MMAPLAGKHKSNEDGLRTQLIHPVFAEKSYPNCFEMWCTNMGRLILVKWRTDFFLENEKLQLTSRSQFHELFLANYLKRELLPRGTV